MAEDMSKLPKPVLAEVNMMVKRLDDDEQAFMKRALLIGVERNFDETTTVGNTVKEFESLATGKGHSYLVRQVASAGMRDGSVTMPKGSVDICPGMRLRFFVRDSEGAKEEVRSLKCNNFVGYNHVILIFVTIVAAGGALDGLQEDCARGGVRGEDDVQASRLSDAPDHGQGAEIVRGQTRERGTGERHRDGVPREQGFQFWLLQQRRVRLLGPGSLLRDERFRVCWPARRHWT